MRAEFPARPTTESISAALACSARGSAQNSAYPRPSRAPPAAPARRIQLIRGLSRTGQDAILLYEVAPGASAEMSASLPARVCIAPESIRYSAPKCNN